MSSAIKIFQGRFGRVALLDMSAPLVGHAHHHCHLLLKAGGADSAFTVRGVHAPLTDETAVLVNAWEHHAYDHGTPNGERCLILALYIETTWLSQIQRSLTVSGHPRFFPQPCVRVKPGTRRIVEEFVLELWWADEIAAARLEQLLFELIMSVIDGCSGWRNLAELLRSKPPHAIDPRVRQSIRYMHENVACDFDMDTLAGSVGLSRGHFFMLFRRETQVTPLVYANVLRLEWAIERLAHTAEPVQDVASDLGFSAPGHFARFFRQHAGITPTEYRRAVNLFEAPASAPAQI